MICADHQSYYVRFRDPQGAVKGVTVNTVELNA